MTTDRKQGLMGCGEPEGLGKRLAYWANQLSRDRSFPWVGLGLIEDLKCAARLQGADFDRMFPPGFNPQPKPVEVPAPSMEFDL